ncbi:hypothetical protein RF11_12269 [Thelohanellus kitauei]|uniref:Uncharacterized protein n=1 Tax=Thelohanellus kitauei TaxID=669202 RepID=A0A0C2NFE2_THEKT|nr:hypothetical protein RF11_12269 [Thelohanellus kitauei]
MFKNLFKKSVVIGHHKRRYWSSRVTLLVVTDDFIGRKTRYRDTKKLMKNEAAFFSSYRYRFLDLSLSEVSRLPVGYLTNRGPTISGCGASLILSTQLTYAIYEPLTKYCACIVYFTHFTYGLSEQENGPSSRKPG